MSFSELKNSVTDIEQRAYIKICVLIGRIIEALNQQGTFYGVSKLPEIWQQVIEAEGDYL